MRAITTKFHGPTNHRRSRYSATDQNGHKVFVSSTYTLSTENEHARACDALLCKLQTENLYPEGSTVIGVWQGNSMVWVPVSECYAIFEVGKFRNNQD